MSKDLTIVPENLVMVDGDRVTTTSLIIAREFHKKHCNVLSAIQNIECSEEFSRLNFKLISYVDTQNRDQPIFEITRDGFIFLVMGFTGKKAAIAKENFIYCFNAMYAKLTQLNKPPLDRKQQMLQQAKMAVEMLENQIRADAEIKEIGSKVDVVEKDINQIKFEMDEAKKTYSLLQIDNEDLSELPQKSLRTNINILARELSRRFTLDYGVMWTKLYHEFYHVYNINIQVRAENRKMKALDYAEAAGLLPNLYKIAVSLVKQLENKIKE